MQIKIIVFALLLVSNLAYSTSREDLNDRQIEVYEKGILSGLTKEFTHEKFKATYLDPFRKQPTSKNYEKFLPTFETFFENCKDKEDKIWMYIFDLAGPGTGRTGIAIVRKEKVVTWLELSIE